jgi:hypothetical protein
MGRRPLAAPAVGPARATLARMTTTDRSRLSRRGFLATTAATTAAASAAALGLPGSAAARQPAGGRTPHGFVEAVLAALRTHRLVAIGEGGTHGLQEHFDALTTLLTDPRLPGLVDAVVVEFGNARYQPTIDRFTAGGTVEDADLRAVWRDTTQSPLGTWDQPVFEHLYRTVRSVNRLLPAGRRIRVLAGDPPIDWSAVTTRDQLATFQVQRDAHAASIVRREVLSRGQRALICYGGQHVLHGRPAEAQTGLVATIEQQTGVRIHVIVTAVPLAGDPGGLGARLASTPAGTVIPAAGTWLGSFDAGLVFPAVPFGLPGGGPPTNVMCGIPLGTLLDAGLHLGPAQALTVSRENPAIYLDTAYWAELHRRNDLQGGLVNLDSLRQQQTVRFAPQLLPDPLRCT